MANRPAWIQNFNASTATFDINSSDPAFASQVFNLRFAIADDGTPVNQGYDTFSVTFEYLCHDLIL